MFFLVANTEDRFSLLILFLIEFLYVNSVDPDQRLCTAASDLSLHCLPRPPLVDTWHNWVP